MDDQIASQILYTLQRIAHALEALARASDRQFKTKVEKHQAKQGWPWPKQQG